MSNVHRRQLADKEPRCTPSPGDCPFKTNCARFTYGLPQGIGATMGNFRGAVAIMTACSMYLSQMISDADAAAEAAKAAKAAEEAKKAKGAKK